MTFPPILVVDENDQPVGKASMTEAQKNGLYHRIVRVMIQDKQGRLLLQKRSEHVSNAPSKWDHSAAGHVDHGETNARAAAREAQEEIGLENVELEEVGSWETHDTSDDGRIFNRFNFLFKGIADDNFEPNIDEFEVAEVKWYALDETKRLIAERPDSFTTGLIYAIKHFY